MGGIVVDLISICVFSALDIINNMFVGSEGCEGVYLAQQWLSRQTPEETDRSIEDSLWLTDHDGCPHSST